MSAMRQKRSFTCGLRADIRSQAGWRSAFGPTANICCMRSEDFGALKASRPMACFAAQIASHVRIRRGAALYAGCERNVVCRRRLGAPSAVHVITLSPINDGVSASPTVVGGNGAPRAA